MITADQLLGVAPIKAAGRLVTREQESQHKNPNLVAGAAKSRQKRSEAAFARAVAIMRSQFKDRVFCAHHVVLACPKDQTLGRGPAARAVKLLAERGELKLVHIDGRRIYYAFASNENPDINVIYCNRRMDQKNRRKACANLLRNWPQARKGFTHYQLMHYLKSDAYAKHAIADLLAAGELEWRKETYRSFAPFKTVYTLIDKCQPTAE